jgi:enamine deaminase RidA (YjgF/YER057c/UK114 family)
MSFHTTLQPEGWAPAKGYANGVLAHGRSVHVAGQIGWNAASQFESDDFVAQTAQALRNVVAVLQCAGAQPDHIVRMTWYVVSRDEYLSRLKDIGRVYRDIIGTHYPAMSAVQVVALMEARARVEIEVTAVIPDFNPMESPGA